jgi:hypothetical protein
VGRFHDEKTGREQRLLLRVIDRDARVRHIIAFEHAPVLVYAGFDAHHFVKQ